MTHTLAALMLLFAATGCMITDRDATTELPGTGWTLVDLDGEEPVDGAVPTIEFGDDGMVSGNTGCNSFNTEATIDGSDLSFGPVASTQMACTEAGVAEQETALLLALDEVTSYTIDSDGRLVLEGGAPLTFEVAPEGG